MENNAVLNHTLVVATTGPGILHDVLDANPEIQALHEKGLTFQVSDIATLGESSDLMKDLKCKRQELIDAHKREKAPVLAEGRTIDRKYKVPKDLLIQSIEALTVAIDHYWNPLKKSATQAQLVEDARLREETSKAIEVANITGAEPDLPRPKAVAKAPKRIETGVSSMSIIEKKKWRIPDIKAGEENTIGRDDIRAANLPDKFFTLDPDAIKRAKEAGEHIPNVEEYYSTRTMSR